MRYLCDRVASVLGIACKFKGSLAVDAVCNAERRWQGSRCHRANKFVASLVGVPNRKSLPSECIIPHRASA